MHTVTTETGVDSSQRRWAVMSLGVFLLAQLLGVFLRLLHLQPQPVNYTHMLYGHTHVALSGWLQAGFYLALSALLPQAMQVRYRWILRLNLLGTLGMMLAFPLQGYKAASIALSSAVILISYAFAIKLWRDSRATAEGRSDPAWRSIRLGLLFLGLSSLGPWSLGLLMVKLPGSDWINLAVYFYLHFFYNGFFSFALLGLLLHWGAQAGYRLPFWPIGLLAAACLPAYALSALWAQPPAWVWALAGLAALMQLIALGGLLPGLLKLWQALRLGVWPRLLLGVSLLSLIAKLLMQSLSALPSVAGPLGGNRYLIIAYLHLVFLGFVTCFLLAWLIDRGLLTASVTGLSLLLAGICASELLLFGSGGAVWLGLGVPAFYSAGMFLGSLPMPLGTAWLLLRQRHRTSQLTLVKVPAGPAGYDRGSGKPGQSLV